MARDCLPERAIMANPKGVQSEVKTSTMSAELREAPVGDSPVLEVLAAGMSNTCILDTGSQVTLFSQSMFNWCVKTAVVKGAAEVPWLTLKAVNGFSLLYMGYVVLDFTVARLEVPQREMVIVEDQHLT